MADIVYCEFLKLRHAKVWLAAFLGTWAVPLLVFVLEVRDLAAGKDAGLFDFYDRGYMFLMDLSAPLLFSVVAAFLFSREYTEKTLKTIFAVPLSKQKFLAGKFISLFFCIVILMIVTWAEILVLAVACDMMFGVQNINIMSGIYFFIQMLYASVLLYAVITPFACLAIRFRSFFAPVLSAVCIAVFNTIFSTLPVAQYFPWTAPHWILTRSKIIYGEVPLAPVLIIGMVCIGSIAASFRRFNKTDIL